MRFHLSICLTFVALAWTVTAVPELEHDMTEVDLHDCRYFTKLTCIRECPKQYVAVYRSLCSAAEDQHECCAVRCCRSRHNGDYESDDNDEIKELVSHSGRYSSYSRSRFERS